MDLGSKLPVTQHRPHAEPGRDNGAGAGSSKGTGTALPVPGLRPFTPPSPRGGWPRGGFEIATSVDSRVPATISRGP